MAELRWFTEAEKDYKRLDGMQRQHIDKGLLRIKEFGMQAGKSLLGDLAMCREIKHKRLGLRIIFKQGDNQDVIEIIDIIIIGYRKDGRVFREAGKRLGKSK